MGKRYKAREVGNGEKEAHQGRERIPKPCLRFAPLNLEAWSAVKGTTGATHSVECIPASASQSACETGKTWLGSACLPLFSPLPPVQLHGYG